MLTREVAPPVVADGPRRAGGWNWAYTLACIGLAGSCYGAWTMVAWLAGGRLAPARISPGRLGLWGQTFQIALTLAALASIVYVVRGCLRHRQLTFDACFCLGGLTAFWIDPVGNFLQPVFFYNSRFVSVRSWCGNFPGIINPVCGQRTEPILLQVSMYGFVLLGLAVVLNQYMQFLRRRWPQLSPLRFWALTLAAPLLFEVLIEVPSVQQHLWSYPGSPSWMSIMGDAHRLPIIEFLSAAVIWVGVVLLRWAKDDRGRNHIERRVDHLRPGPRRAVTVLAVSGVIYLLVGQNVVFVQLLGFYSSPYPKVPASLLNGVCDPPGRTGSQYGPCPGSPGYRMPVRDIR